MEGKISKKNAKQLIQKAENSVKGNVRINKEMKDHWLRLISYVDSGNCSPTDQDMLVEFINGY